MSKAVILAINAKYVHSSLAAWYLAGGVSRYARLPHDVTVAEATINQQNEDIAKQVAAYKPDVVGISVYIWNAGKLMDVLTLLRGRLPKAVFVLGGPEASCRAEHWLNRGADFVIRGEGERSFPALLDILDDNLPAENIPGLCWNQNGEVRTNPEAGLAEDCTDPYSEAYFAALNGRIAYIETSRGCPYRCAFCLSGGSGVRLFPVEAVKERLLRLSKSETQTVKFVDRTFNCNTQRAYELFEYIIGMDTACCFHFEVAADLFDERTLSLLKTAPPGRIQLEAGLQSFFEPALKASFRHMDFKKTENNILTLLQVGNIHVHVDLIAGLPYETLPDFADSFDRAYALGAHTLQVGFLKLLYGSALREQEKSIVCSEEPPYEIICSPWLSVGDLKILKQTENALQHTYNKGRFLSALRYVLSVTGMRPFYLYRTLGEAVQNHGTPLKDYAEQIYNCCVKLTGIEPDKLKEHMICDWLGMVKGANMPPALRIADKRRRKVALIAEKLLGHKLRRDEAYVLPSGKGVFVDSKSCDPVTGLYRLHFVEI